MQEMVGDHMTKPPQGALFWKFHDMIMGVHPAECANATKSNKPGLMLSKSKEWCHRSVLEQTVDPAKLINDHAKIPTKKDLKECKCNAHEQSHKHCWLDPRMSDSDQATLRNMEMSGM